MSLRIFCFLMQDIKASRGEATAVSLDVSKGRAKIAEGIKKAVDAYGQVDILVRVTSFSPFYAASTEGSECPSRGCQIKVASLQWLVLAFKETIYRFDALLDMREIIYLKSTNM
jgi:hypothetical protein